MMTTKTIYDIDTEDETTDITEDKELWGQILLEMGFQKWFLFFFKMIECCNFDNELLHQTLFNSFEDIYKMNYKRIIINIPPRAGKTTLAVYFIAFCLAVNPKCNFIYTSYSQQLANANKDRLWSILNSDIWQEMYSNTAQEDSFEDKVVDRFWQDTYYKQPDAVGFKIRGGRIQTSSGGCIIFNSLGSQITGFGAGIRNKPNEFTGCILIDDPNKPSDMFSEYMQDKIFDYYKNTLLSRCNNSNVAICIIQQRLNVRDLSGLILENYKNFTLIKRPLVVDGICQLPHQYDKEKLEEIQVDKYTFQSQYQQDPITDQDSVIKQEWFQFYDCNIEEIDFTHFFITTDVAYSKEKASDNSCICVWGYSRNDCIYLIDMIWDKIAPENFCSSVMYLWNKYKKIKCCNMNYTTISAIYIETNRNELLIKLLQDELNNLEGEDLEIGTYIKTLQRDMNFTKQLRMVATLKHLPKRKVLFPINRAINNDIIQKAIRECELFRMDDSHKHDDFVDNLMDAVLITYGNPGYADDNFNDCYSQFA